MREYIFAAKSDLARVETLVDLMQAWSRTPPTVLIIEDIQIGSARARTT